jgi:murein DD-endopeptidase MepM/ murein hydrolase activator NlpD
LAAIVIHLVLKALSTLSHCQDVEKRREHHEDSKNNVLDCVQQLRGGLAVDERLGGLYLHPQFLLNYAAMLRFHVSFLRLRVASTFLSAFIIFTQFSSAQISPAQTTITVQPGDTLWALAQRYNTTTQDILQVNGLTGQDLLPGAILTLPANSTVAPETYTVQAGDTLYDIAVAFSMTTDELIAINNLDGTTIKPGQALTLKVLASEAPPAPLVVTVQPGDTLWALAINNDTTTEALVQANNLANAAAIRPGDTLTIPGRYAATSTADQGGTVPQTVAVAKGDTLWDIASRYNTSVTALMSANNMADTSIKVGQTLKIIPANELLKASSETPPQPSSAVSTAAMLWPAHGQITSYFGYRRLRIGGTNMHYGLDIDGETGDPIEAAVAGMVTYSGWRNGFGNLVIVTNGNTEYYYAHASEIFVGEGQSVEVGQHIANVGATGRVTGSHLHFEVRVDGTPVDPLPLLQQYAGNP